MGYMGGGLQVMKKIIILGSTGMLGNTVLEYFLSTNNYEVSGSVRDVSLKNDNNFIYEPVLEDDVRELPRADYFINCIGIIKPHMLKNIEHSIYLNSLFPRELADECSRRGAGLIHITTDCFLPNTNVLTVDGYKFIQDLNVGDFVYTHSGVIEKIYKFLPKYVKETVYAIKTMGNDVVKCTKNHPWLSIIRGWKEAPDLDEVGWHVTKELKVGNLIAIPKLNVPIKTIDSIDLSGYSDKFKNKITEYDLFLNKIKDKDINVKQFCRLNNLKYSKVNQWLSNPLQRPNVYDLQTELQINKDTAWFLGLFLAEGWVDNNKYRKTICITLGDEPELINKTISVISEYLNIVPNIRYLKNQKGCQINFTHQFLSEMLSIDFYTDKFNKYSYTKKIPSWFINTGKENIRYFLKGYFEGDGCFYENDKKSCFLTMTSVSEKLVDDIKLFFTMLGVLPNKTFQNTAGISTICGRTVNIKNRYNLTISGRQLNKAFKLLDIKSKHFENVVRYQRFYENDKYWFVPITGMEEEYYEGFVYNLEVEKEHSYLVNGGLSAHNCVFSGEDGNYDEDSAHDASDDYGKSKSLGEPENCMVLRTSIIGPEVHNNASLISWVQAQGGKKINGFTNHLWNGITTLQYAKVCDQIISNNWYDEDLYHIYSPNIVNKFELVSMINDRYSVGANITPVEALVAIDRTMSTKKGLCAKLNIPELKDQIEQL